MSTASALWLRTYEILSFDGVVEGRNRCLGSLRCVLGLAVGVKCDHRLCAPQLRWKQRFRRPVGRPDAGRNDREARIRGGRISRERRSSPPAVTLVIGRSTRAEFACRLRSRPLSLFTNQVDCGSIRRGTYSSIALNMSTGASRGIGPGSDDGQNEWGNRSGAGLEINDAAAVLVDPVTDITQP